jgi:hypothetical protein
LTIAEEKTTMKKWMFLIVAVCAASAYADEPKYCNIQFAGDTAQSYPESVKSAKETLKALCHILEGDRAISAEALHGLFVSFHDTLADEASKKMPALMPSLGLFSRPLFEYKDLEATVMIPEVIFFTDPNNPEDQMFIYTAGSRQHNYEQVIPRTIALRCFTDIACRKNLKMYRDLLVTVYNPFKSGPLKMSSGFINAKDNEWISFIEDSRSQTFIDISVSTTIYKWLYDGKDEHDFQSPPSVQWFALHPSVVIENISDAVDGEQLQESLALEIFGFNYWKKKCFGFACGASLIVNYADRESVEDSGWGVMFHVDNSYSFGFTKHAGDTGFFVTADLLKLFQDKKSSYKQYKDKYRSIQ